VYIRILGSWWGRHKDGECHYVHERVGAGWVARGGAEEVDVRVYDDYVRRGIRWAALDTLDREAITRDVLAALAQKPAAGGKRVVTGAEWRRELGQPNNVDEVIRAVRDMAITMSHASLDDGQRTVELVAATDAPIRRREYNFRDDTEQVYDETLDMSPGAVRLERLNKGAPLLDSHNYGGGTSAIIGAVVPGSARVRAGALTARVKFSRSENGDRAFQDAKDGILRSVSVGYLIHAKEIDDGVSPPMHRIIDWEPHEISAVAIPADRNAGFRETQNALVS
jgi:hypothetical protein